MQKLVNAMAVTAFLMSGTLTAIAVVAYTKIPQLTTRFMDQVQTEIQSKISEAIAGASVSYTHLTLPTNREV